MSIGPMKKYETFELWMADRPAKHRRLINVLRKLVKKAAPRLTETVKWGNGCWEGGEWPVAFIHAEDDHLQFGFFGGSSLTDPKKLLLGNGKYVRHIKVRVPSDIDEVAFSKLVRLAAKAERE